ncbi:hypothetical protein GCM10009087_12060 [Sphingomonas oligophenolica]|uniref:Uncharacterized protein n=1 Tax=Sphingomonas oligophenolica TaxID=301154 RepID=A0ABU9Y480_9SPHN
MADPADLTVRELLPDDMKAMDKAVGKLLHDDTTLREAHLPAALNGPIAERVTAAVADALDFKVLPVVAYAWARAREIHRYRTPDAGLPADATATLFLGEHEVSAELHPQAVIDIAGVGNVTMKFTLVVAARMRAAQLSIRRGHIIRIGKTDGSVSAQLTYGGVPLHKGLRSRDWVLVGDHALAEPGILIP